MIERLTAEELAIFPLSAGDIADIREHHFPVPYRTDGSERLMCAQDDAWWPCALIQALNTIDALEVENKRLRRALQDAIEEMGSANDYESLSPAGHALMGDAITKARAALEARDE